MAIVQLQPMSVINKKRYKGLGCPKKTDYDLKSIKVSKDGT